MKNIAWLFLILLIFVRYLTTRPVYKNGDRLRITTIVYSDPVIFSTAQYLKIAGLKVYLPRFPEISYGDSVVVEGIVKDDKLEDSKIISVKPGGILSGFRNKVVAFYSSVLPQPESGLMSGIVLGSKGALSSDFYNKTKRAGVAHVVVASGTNVTFVVSFLMSTFAIYFARRKAILFALIGIFVYLFISGFEAPLIRAAVMASITFAAQLAGRMVNPWRVLGVTVLGMLAFNPDWIFDIGFILSFASTLSIMLFEHRLRLWLSKLPGFLKESFSTSLAAQIGVAPILFVTFGQFNLLSPLINALILWTVPPLMVIGSVGAIVGLILPGLGKLILLVGYPLLWWFVKVIELFS